MHIEIKLEGSTSNFVVCLCPTFMNDAEFKHQAHTMRWECKDESLVDGEWINHMWHDFFMDKMWNLLDEIFSSGWMKQYHETLMTFENEISFSHGI
jgi:hypothetical protein